MNKYIQDYLKQREEKEKKVLEREVNRIIQNLEIGEKVYNEKEKYPKYDYPKFDTEKKMPFKYDIGDATIEELRLFLQTVSPKKEETKPLEPVKRSKWYTFATIMIVLSAIGLCILGIVSISEEDPIFFLIGLGEFFMVSLFCAIVQLLAGLKQNFDTLLKKRK